MDNSKKTMLLEEMDILLEKFLNSRAYFPYMTEKDKGKIDFDTSPLYADLGYHITFKLEKPLTMENINKNNELSHWHNQNFIIRLYSLMDSYGYRYPFDDKIDGYEEVDILRRLRNIFAHTSGKYNKLDEKEKTMLIDVVEHFKLEDKTLDHIPLSIDDVIKPIFNNCQVYINNWVDKNKSAN